MRLKNKAAFITGGNSGMGLETAKLFEQEGAKVAIVGRRQEAIETFNAQASTNAYGWVADVASQDQTQQALSQANEKFGKIDILFINAGIAKPRPFEMADRAYYDAMWDVNFAGAYFTIQAALPYLKNGASIILNTSVSNTKGMPGLSVYAATKAGPSGKVVAFEPNPETLRMLRANIALNQCQNIIVEPRAASNENKSGKIYDRWDVNRGGASLIKPDFDTDSYDIEEVRLSDYFSPSDPVDMIKADVEGYELEVLKGAESILQRKVPPMLVMECANNRSNTFGESVEPLISFIQKVNQYRIFRAEKGKEIASKLVEVNHYQDLPRIDNIYCLTNHHIENAPKGVFKGK